MDTAMTAIPPSDPARAHTLTSLSVLAVVAAVCGSLLYLAHDPTYDEWQRRYRWEEARRSKDVFLPLTHFKNDADRVLNVEIPSTDFSRGGIYLFGTSNLEWGLKLWALPPVQAARFHNFAVNGVGHAAQLQLIRFLVEDEGLLRAGPEKTLVVLAACYQNAGFVNSDTSVQSRILASRGFYTRGPDGSIHRSGTSDLMRTFVAEKLRLEGISRELAHIARLEIDERRGRLRPRVLDPDGYLRYRAELLGPNWRERIRIEVDAFAAMVDYLRERKVPIVVVLMPEATWEVRRPFDGVYNDELLQVCRPRGLEVHDLRKLLDDEDYADSNHFNPNGVEKFQAAILPFCLEHLRAAKLLDEPQADRRPEPGARANLLDDPFRLPG